MALAKLVRSDVFRLHGRYSHRLLMHSLLSLRTFRVIFSLRICANLSASGRLGRIALPFAQFLHRLNTASSAMDFPWRTRVGAGLALTHGWGVVINPGAVIGNNVTIFHGVTLGRRDRIDDQGDRTYACPVIEDDVWIAGPMPLSSEALRWVRAVVLPVVRLFPRMFRRIQLWSEIRQVS
jgi:serine O-acetyltransferase